MAQTANYNLEKPSTDKNVDEEFYQLQETLDLLDAILAALQTAVNGKSAVGHTHAISDVVNLAAELAAKMPASATFKLDDLTDVSGADGAPNGYVLVKSALGWLPSSALAALGTHGHLISEITGLVDALAGKADAVATADALALRVRIDAAQSLTQAQRGQARANIGAGILAGLRNKLINGAAQIIQRGGRTIAAGASAYVFDRFLVTNNTNQTVTVSQVAFALGSGFAREARNAMRFNFAVAPTTGTLRIEQRIELVDSIRPTDHTFIAWMSGPNGSEVLAAEIVQNFGTGGSPSAQVVTPMIFAGSSPTTIYSASTNRRAWGVTVPSLSGKLFGNNGNDYAAAALVMTPRQAGNYDLTWLSFVEGDATAEEDPFGTRHFQQELALCQRYFNKSYQLQDAPGTVTNAGALGTRFGSSASNQTLNIPLPVEMRALPSVVFYNPVTGGTGTWRNFNANGNVSVQDGSTTTTSSRRSISATIPTGSNPDLYAGHYAADAEL